ISSMGTVSRPLGMRPKWHKKRIKRLKLRRRRMRQRSK
ncbi:ribosomal protein L41, putative, partial [Bodo saltans]